MKDLAIDIWASYRRMPLWVQLWVGFILVPVNAASIFFIGAPGGVIIAILAIGGMLPNIGVMMVERGFSNTMAIPHVVLWPPLLVIVGGYLADTALVDGGWRTYLIILLVVDVISLAFDIPDTWRWFKGNRNIA